LSKPRGITATASRFPTPAVPECQTGPRITPTRAETRAQRYRRLAIAETDAERAKVLWQLVEDAQRGALCMLHDDHLTVERSPGLPADH
jgi:hypothetical protein